MALFDLFWLDEKPPKLRKLWVFFFQFGISFVFGGLIDVLIPFFGSSIINLTSFLLSRSWRLSVTLSTTFFAKEYINPSADWKKVAYNPFSLKDLSSFLFGFSLGTTLILGVVFAGILFGSSQIEPSEWSASSFATHFTLLFCWFIHAIHEEVQFRCFWWFFLVHRKTESHLSIGPFRASKKKLVALFSSLIFGAVHLQNRSATPLSIFNLFFVGMFLFFALDKLKTISFLVGFHTAVNEVMSILGTPISGRTLPFSLWMTTPDRWNGEEFGPEGSFVFSIILLLYFPLILKLVS